MCDAQGCVDIDRHGARLRLCVEHSAKLESRCPGRRQIMLGHLSAFSFTIPAFLSQDWPTALCIPVVCYIQQ